LRIIQADRFFHSQSVQVRQFSISVALLVIDWFRGFLLYRRTATFGVHSLLAIQGQLCLEKMDNIFALQIMLPRGRVPSGPLDSEEDDEQIEDAKELMAPVEWHPDGPYSAA
jgi:hypothetical protein